MNVQTFLVVRTPTGERRIETTDCYWCASLQGMAVCALCSAKADAIRKEFAA
jgi:hypothetical protein